MPVSSTNPGLLERAADGSGKALGRLYERYWPLPWRWAFLATGSRTRADDLAQEAFVRAFGALERFDRSGRLGRG